MQSWKAGNVLGFPPRRGWGGGGSMDSPAGPEAGGTSGPVGVLLGQGAEKAGWDKWHLPPSLDWAVQGAACAFLAKILPAEMAASGWTHCSQRAKGLLGFSQNKGTSKYCCITKSCYSRTEQAVIPLETSCKSHQWRIPGFLSPPAHILDEKGNNLSPK